jgi:protein-L-isoaspartate(D-aspartate) O-methyltransferase
MTRLTPGLTLAVCLTIGCTQSADLVRSRAVREQAFARGVKDEAILAALREVPRESFLPPEQAAQAYEDGPRRISDDEVLPSIYLVGTVLSLARPQGDDRMLEFGTSTGYQAAVASKLVARVHAMDNDEARIAEAGERFEAMGITNVSTRSGFVNDGWEAAAPFDVIVLWDSPSYVPTMLLNQLQLGGRLVIIRGGVEDPTQIRIVEKQRDRSTRERVVIPTAK